VGTFQGNKALNILFLFV